VTQVLSRHKSSRSKGKDEEAAAEGNPRKKAQQEEEAEGGDAAYVAASCALSVEHDEDARVAARLEELPPNLPDAFCLGVLQPLEVRYGRELVEALMLQLLAATTGVPRADLKLILKHQFAPLDNAAWLPAADIAVDRCWQRWTPPYFFFCFFFSSPTSQWTGAGSAGRSYLFPPFCFFFLLGDRVLAALDAFLLPALPAHDSIYLEHSMLRLAAWRRYGTYMHVYYVYIV
jgi:hypothetical protein